MGMYWPVVKEDLFEKSQRKGFGNFQGFAETAERMQRNHAFDDGRLVESSVRHGSLNDRGANRVHADTVLGIFDGGRLGETQHAVPASDVDARSGCSNQACH